MKITVSESLVPLFLAVFFIVVLIFTCLMHRWFTSDNVRHQNPCKLITEVLSFTRKHKFPHSCSAFTFSDDERPSRLDFAKERFGGPFTTEQAEDTKSLILQDTCSVTRSRSCVYHGCAIIISLNGDIWISCWRCLQC